MKPSEQAIEAADRQVAHLIRRSEVEAWRSAMRRALYAAYAVDMPNVDDCECPPCPGRGNDGHGLTHCAECCFGTWVEADPACPIHGYMPNVEHPLTDALRESPMTDGEFHPECQADQACEVCEWWESVRALLAQHTQEPKSRRDFEPDPFEHEWNDRP